MKHFINLQLSISKKYWQRFMEYPFSYITNFRENSEKYISVNVVRLQEINITPNINVSSVTINDIKKVFWLVNGEPDESQWRLIGMIKIKKNYYYFYYEAGCCYTGFELEGEHKLYLYSDFDDLYNFGLDEYTRELIKHGNGITAKSINENLKKYKLLIKSNKEISMKKLNIKKINFENGKKIGIKITLKDIKSGIYYENTNYGYNTVQGTKYYFYFELGKASIWYYTEKLLSDLILDHDTKILYESYEFP